MVPRSPTLGAAVTGISARQIPQQINWTEPLTSICNSPLHDRVDFAKPNRMLHLYILHSSIPAYHLCGMKYLMPIRHRNEADSSAIPISEVKQK